MMCVKIIVTFFLMLFVSNLLAYNDKEYEDSVINMLLNGDSFEVEESQGDNQEQDIHLIGGIWKCGNCADVDDSKLVYSEINDLEIDVNNDQAVDLQISVSIPTMSCVTVVGYQPGIVQRVTGTCTGTHVTLSVVAVKHFTINVYAE